MYSNLRDSERDRYFCKLHFRHGATSKLSPLSGVNPTSRLRPPPSLPIIIFLNVSNIDPQLWNIGDHIGSITAPLWRLSVTESFALPPDLRWNAMTDYPAAIPLLAIQRLGLLFVSRSPGPLFQSLSGAKHGRVAGDQFGSE